MNSELEKMMKDEISESKTKLKNLSKEKDKINKEMILCRKDIRFKEDAFDKFLGKYKPKPQVHPAVAKE